MSSVSCIHVVELINTSNTTSDVTGDFIATPIGISRYYLKLVATENSAGSITIEFTTNESRSTTGAEIVDSDTRSATTVAARTLDTAVSGQLLLGPIIYVDLTTVSGDWDISLQLWYSKTDVV